MIKCSKCGREAEGTAEHGEHLKAQKHLPAHSQPEHTEYTAYQDKRKINWKENSHKDYLPTYLPALCFVLGVTTNTL
jgi:hypothetical protein